MINLTDNESINEKINVMMTYIDEISNALWNAHMHDSAYSFRRMMEDACDSIRADVKKMCGEFSEALNKKTAECLAAGENDKPKSTSFCCTNDGTELFEPFCNTEDDKNSGEEKTEIRGTFADLLNDGLKSIGKCLNEICGTDSAENGDNDNKGDFCTTSDGDNVSMASDLMKEYKAENVDSPSKDGADAREPECCVDPADIADAVIAVVSDRKAHKYRFIKGENGASPAVEVVIDDKWSVADRPDVVLNACDDVRKRGFFSLVTMSSTANPGKLTFFLVLV